MNLTFAEGDHDHGAEDAHDHEAEVDDLIVRLAALEQRVSELENN